MLSKLVVGGIEHIMCDSTGSLLDAYVCFPPDFSMSFFPLLIFCVPFHSRSLSHGSNYILSPVSPPYESPDLGVLLGG